MERDSLAGLLNHARFKDRLVHELERCSRNGGELGFAMIDLDRFKPTTPTDTSWATGSSVPCRTRWRVGCARSTSSAAMAARSWA
jgi:predicted signal transduction protein with EAL and GGDEF domain